MVKPYIHPVTNLMTSVLNNDASIQLHTTMVKRTLPYSNPPASELHSQILKCTPYLAACLQLSLKNPKEAMVNDLVFFSQWLTTRLGLVWET